MFYKPVFIALGITLLSSLSFLLIFVSLTGGLNLSLGDLPVIAAVVFVLSLAAAWLGSRPKPPHGKQPGRPDRTATGGPRESGSVKWFNASKGFGFITRDSGDDVFVHFRAIRGSGHRVLHDGQRVEFCVSRGSKGLQAEDVEAAP